MIIARPTLPFARQEDPERVGKLEAMVQGFVKQKHVTCMALKGLRTSIALDKDRWILHSSLARTG